MKRYTKKCAIWHAKNFAKSFGFTLAELLVSVLIISIIMVVLAPVITKRVTSNINVSGGGGSTKKESKLFLYNPTDPDCSAVSGQSALDCNFTTGTGVKSVNVVMVSGGGGGAGGTPPTTEYGKKLTVTNSTIGSAKTQEITISKNMKNFVVSYLSGSGGGGGGGAWSESAGAAPTSQADCDKYDAKFLTASQNGGKAVCVTKYNIGDIPNATNGGIATSVTTVSTGTNCSANACCWQGQTSNPSICDSSGTSYSGCNRTVCTWYAGNASCQALAYNGTKAGDWRLPTKNELSKWESNISTINTNKGDNGLRLCDDSSGCGAAQCHGYYTCDGSSGRCGPNYVWSSTAHSSGSYYNVYHLFSRTFTQSYDNPRFADSVRCVLEGGGSTYNSYGGGGGSGASFFKNYQIPDDLIVNNIGGRIVFYAAPGAKGGNGASSSNSNASNGYSGTASYIALYDKTNKLIWGLEASGGNGGRGATSTNAGNGGSSVATNSCKIFQNNVWTDTNCTGVGSAGSNGASLDTGGNGAASGGVGGGSLYNTTTLSGGGNGGSSGSEVGGNGSLYGSGGGGGTTKVVSDVATAGAGGKGANGVAEITYDITYDPAAGGGGGGGAMLKVENITVTPSTNYVIRVGGGGNGGAVSNNGSDGGESRVTFGGVSYSLSGGKGGTAGTSATDTTSVVHGVGGLGASKLSAGTSVAGTKGSDGSAGDIGAIGGNGGKSGVESEGGCGALFDNGGSCSATGAYGLSPLFVSPSNVFDAADYGKAGAGGGGGGYAYNTTMYPTNNPGYGGNGQNGYVYLYWTEYN